MFMLQQNYQKKFDGNLKKWFFNTYKLLNMEDITDADYTHRERLCEDFELKRLGKSHYLYV